MNDADRRSVRVLAPALAAAAVVGLTVGVLLAVRQPATHDGSALNPFTSRASEPRTVTTRAVQRLLVTAPVVPGAVAVDHSPTKALAEPMAVPASPNLVQRARWWTAPGTVSAALSYLRSHVPRGVTPNGSMRAGGTGPSVQGLTFAADGKQWSRPTVYTEFEMQITATPLGSGVAIRVDTQAVWLPPRTSAELIPTSVTSVHVVVDRNGRAATARRTLGRVPARSLATVVNRLPVDVSGHLSCPAEFGFVDTLTFRGPDGAVRVRAGADGCGFVTIYRPRALRPMLSGGYSVDHAVTAALGLPRGYGR